MDVVLHKNFEKSFAKLSPKQKEKVKITIIIFKRDPHDERLNNHALHGKESAKRAISAGGDLRLIFEQENNYQRVTFYRVGTHNQVY